MTILFSPILVQNTSSLFKTVLKNKFSPCHKSSKVPSERVTQNHTQNFKILGRENLFQM